ncbi:hypothetical protein [Streptomyces sp. NPDC052107]|uniref:hypothetical protein n=1 Tax=Streptomyces sp. NPDC052107 TaxID=3155632 RepID=UPI003430DB80
MAYSPCGTGSRAALSTDEQLHAAQTELARPGLWAGLSAAAGLAGLRACADEDFDGPVVCVPTSSGFKDRGVGQHRSGPLPPEWTAVRAGLRAAGPGG